VSGPLTYLKPLTRREAEQLRAVEIVLLAAEFANARPTCFATEADTVHQRRAHYCLHGWRYWMADATAREDTLAALDYIGAERPSWQEGQPVILPLDVARCEKCGAGLYFENEQRYCDACRDRAVYEQQMAYVRATSERKAEARAGMTCEVCGKPINAKRSDAKTCGGTKCREELKRRRAPTRICEHCREEFQSRYERAFCSRKCWHEAQIDRRPLCYCVWCGREFRSRKKGGTGKPRRFCCDSHRAAWWSSNKNAHPFSVRAFSAETRPENVLRPISEDGG
jgi:hypothetical protein